MNNDCITITVAGRVATGKTTLAMKIYRLLKSEGVNVTLDYRIVDEHDSDHLNKLAGRELLADMDVHVQEMQLGRTGVGDKDYFNSLIDSMPGRCKR